MESIIAAAITGGCSILAIIITVAASNRKIEHQLELSQAVMNTKIESLTTEVRHHNEFARRMPVYTPYPSHQSPFRYTFGGVGYVGTYGNNFMIRSE